MSTIPRIKCWSALLACAGLWLSVSSLHAGKLYKWVDENGQIRYGDRVPPQYAKKSNETLNKQGVVIDKKAAAKTKHQIAEEQRLAKVKAEQERKRQEQAHLDRILLDTFTNEDEMILTRDGKIEAIEAEIRVTKSRTEKIKQRLAEQKLRAANLERAGKAVPQKLQRNIREARRQIHYNSEYVANRRKAQQAIRKTFEVDINRFRALKMAEAAEAQAASE
jgi:hypothetical protein